MTELLAATPMKKMDDIKRREAAHHDSESQVGTRAFTYGNQSRLNYDLTDERREEYRRSSNESREAKKRAMAGLGDAPLHAINVPRLDPMALMPQKKDHALRGLSLFSGGGGFDLGFQRAGFSHVASYDIIPICGSTLSANRPRWAVHAGPVDGDVRRVDWKQYAGRVDVVHGGPPCQPFSIAGQQKGKADERNMWGEFIRAIHAIRPRAFVAENVLGLLDPKFQTFVEREIITPLKDYSIHRFEINAADFGVPQLRRRVIFVGVLGKKAKFQPPTPTHSWAHLKGERGRTDSQLAMFGTRTLPPTMGVRTALGLSDIGYDALAPTIRSGFTGKRNTTSILNSKAGEAAWAALAVWGSGIQGSREAASAFVAKNGHFRLSIQDCGILQGFPESWAFQGAVYQALGQIGNSVCPPVAYTVARALAESIG